MKQFGFRLFCANAMIVLTLLSLILLALGHFVSAFSETVNALLPNLAIVVSACALLFALCEAVFLYQSWKLASGSKRERSTREMDV